MKEIRSVTSNDILKLNFKNLYFILSYRFHLSFCLYVYLQDPKTTLRLISVVRWQIHPLSFEQVVTRSFYVLSSK